MSSCFFWRQHCVFLLGLLHLVYLHCSTWLLPLPMQHFRPILAFKPLGPPSAYFVSSPSAPSPPPHAPSCLSTPPASSSPQTLLGFFNGILGVSKPGALNFYAFFGLIPLTLSESRNLTSIYLPLSGLLDSLLCDLIALTPGLAFSLQIPRTLVASSSFLSGRVYLSLNFLPPFFLRLTSTLIM